MMNERINYIHQNPVKRGYVDEGKHWRYSSARDYEGEIGLIGIERFFYLLFYGGCGYKFVLAFVCIHYQARAWERGGYFKTNDAYMRK